MTMPGITGAKAIEVMASVNPDVPVVLSSGHMRDDAVGNIPDGLYAGYLQKPSLLKELATQVNSALLSPHD